MKQEDKDLLLKDLCGRLPYKVKFRYKYIDSFFREKYGTSVLKGVLPPYRIIYSTLTGEEYLQIEKDEIKPYLFPISSMTEEQKNEFNTKSLELQLKVIDDEIMYEEATEFEVDFYNKHHLDWKGNITSSGIS